jgi:hypothetical protein
MPTLALAPLSPPPAQQPANPTFSQSTHFIIATPSWKMDEVRDRIITRVSPAREIEANVFGCYPQQEFKVAPPLGIYRPLFDMLRCAALFSSCCLLAHTRRVSLPCRASGGKSADAERGK